MFPKPAPSRGRGEQDVSETASASDFTQSTGITVRAGTRHSCSDIMYSAMKAKCHDIAPIANLLCPLLNCLTLRFDAFMDYSLPEILRVPLEELCLHIMVCNLDTYNYACYHKWKKYHRCSCCSLVEMSVRFSRGLSEPGLRSSSTSVSQ